MPPIYAALVQLPALADKNGSWFLLSDRTNLPNGSINRGSLYHCIIYKQIQDPLKSVKVGLFGCFRQIVSIYTFRFFA